MVFVDEIGFRVNRNVNNQNNRYLYRTNPVQVMISICAECIQNFRALMFQRNSNNSQTVFP